MATLRTHPAILRDQTVQTNDHAPQPHIALAGACRRCRQRHAVPLHRQDRQIRPSPVGVGQHLLAEPGREIGIAPPVGMLAVVYRAVRGKRLAEIRCEGLRVDRAAIGWVFNKPVLGGLVAFAEGGSQRGHDGFQVGNLAPQVVLACTEPLQAISQPVHSLLRLTYWPLGFIALGT